MGTNDIDACAHRHGRNYLNRQKQKFPNEFTQIKYEKTEIYHSRYLPTCNEFVY